MVRSKAVLFAAVLLSAAVSLSSCFPGKTEAVASEAAQTVSAAITSDEADIYVLGDGFADRSGAVLEGYAFDDTGNIADEAGNIAVSASGVRVFSWVTALSPADPAQCSQTAEAETAGGITLIKTVTFAVRFEAPEAENVNRRVTIESTDPASVYFPYDRNTEILVPDTEAPGDNALPCIEAEVDREGMLTVIMTACYEGRYMLVARNVFGDPIGECTVEIGAVFGADDEHGTHEHVFDAETVSPTVYAQGCTAYTCRICGYSYRDSYVPALACDHSFAEKTVPPTYVSGGFTLRTCSACGYSYRSDETEKLVCAHETMAETVVRPTCTEPGYTVHTCSICRNFSRRDSETAASGHSWDNGTTGMKATCGSEGIRTLTCRKCGEQLSEVIPATGKHSYRTAVQEPSCTESGYTAHVCSVCGDTYTDREKAMLGHSAELCWTVTAEASCGKPGTKTGACLRCGAAVESEAIPATGNHSYYDTVIRPTCTEQGYTLSTCSVCGNTCRNSYTEPLGHTSDCERRITKEPTCRDTGIRTAFCKRCGAALGTESIPATGVHTYTASVIRSTCTEGGCTVHTCTGCGASYTDSETAAGHLWGETQCYEGERTTLHMVCTGCGTDMTARGWGNSQIAAHTKEHALAGEASGYYSVPVTDTVRTTYRVCTRCGEKETLSWEDIRLGAAG